MYKTACVLLFVSSLTQAASLGNYGQVFEINELDIRTIISSKLTALKQSGKLSQLEEKIKHKTVNQVMRPNATIVETRNKTNIHYIDPSVVLNRDIYNENGRLIAKKGTKVNPFERVNLSKVLVFLNFDDIKQVKYAISLKEKYNNIKFILTSGNIKEGQETFRRVYFDMHGALSAKLNITHVPAIAEQSGLLWKVTEVGQGDE